MAHRVRRPILYSGSDQGIALVVALLVTVIAFIIMTGVLAEAIHNIARAGYVRRRIAAVSAAEAGLNWYAQVASSATLTSLSNPGLGWTHSTTGPDAGWYVKGPLEASGGPEKATFRVFVRYSKTTPCPDITDLTTCLLTNMGPALDLTLFEGPGEDPFPDPAYAIVRAIGTSGSVSRALEQYVRLRPTLASLAGGLSAISLCMGTGAKVTVYGDLTINNQRSNGTRPAAFSSVCPETYATGDIVLDQGKYLRTASYPPLGAGNLYIRGGGLWVQGQRYLKIEGNLWVENDILLGCSGAACQEKVSDPCAISGTIQCVRGTATGRVIKMGTYGHIQGSQTKCTSPCPPPSFFNVQRWPSQIWEGWNIIETTDTSESALKNAIESATTKTVLHITGGSCDVQMPAATITLKTSVALVSECSYSFTPPGTTLAKSPSSCTTCALLVMSVVPLGATLESLDCGNPSFGSPGPHDVSIKGNQDFSNVGFFIYTPCFLLIEGNQCQGCTNDPTPDEIDGTNGQSNGNNEVPISGQFSARYMMLKNGVRLIQNDILTYIPNLPSYVSSFKQDVKFVRELPVTDVLAYV